MATISLIYAVVLAVPAWLNIRAQPAEISEAKTISGSAFRLDSAESASSQESSAAEKSSDNSENAKLADELFRVLDSHGKKLVGAEHETHMESVRSAVDSWAASEEYGVEFVKAQTKFMDEVLSRPDVAKRIKGSEAEFYDVTGGVFSQFVVEYQKEKDRIAADKAKAQEAATAKNMEGLKALSIIGGAIASFITLVLMLVMFRVDRSIRQIANLQKNA
ncbi:MULTISPECIES: hypothetical protein [unclassified Caballeronia]|uniref:hypothetical protein n=1 Tax=unclassified Caballeronia TaxID=2646786 RepID=UPI0028655D1F|nr:MULTISPECIES: hypothetical protein [unclassified Caballeronia]MDR5739402.1 hypothetical protein [Caballeronia sp. LZ016]MDR5807890.1 hypothetical protein [Caballeronia sp. LZ019]